MLGRGGICNGACPLEIERLRASRAAEGKSPRKEASSVCKGHRYQSLWLEVSAGRMNPLGWRDEPSSRYRLRVKVKPFSIEPGLYVVPLRRLAELM